MLFDPLEKQFHLPATLVKGADSQRGERGLVGQKYQCLAGFGVLETDAPQMTGIILFGIKAVQGDGLVADYAAGSIRRRGIDPMGVQVRLGPNDEKSASLM